MIVAARTFLYVFIETKPKRIMSILNLALQCVGLMRDKMSGEFEKKPNSNSGLSSLREFAEMSDDNRHEMTCAFMDQCTRNRAYFFCIKKCGDADCNICAPPRLPPDMFAKLHVLPDPFSGEDQHYKTFQEVYGTDTTEEHKPSSVTKTQTGHQIPCSPSAKTANTVQMTVTCVDCDKPRVIYSATKLNASEKIVCTLIHVVQFSRI
ncbi:unnamed protein product [Mytilus coruscus]|uniref:Uncharacterized protein n=1 Tax=Mytilus coruscus TaxID=42192 RepID=A0A6J8CVW6_MYTCO|nr:unnamed protein product [Mytilus coruscus]